jgi:hypothetical protein
MIAHRLSTVRSADLILVLNHGELVEQGTHDNLLDWDSLYRQLHIAQTGQAQHLASVERFERLELAVQEASTSVGRTNGSPRPDGNGRGRPAGKGSGATRSHAVGQPETRRGQGPRGNPEIREGDTDDRAPHWSYLFYAISLVILAAILAAGLYFGWSLGS